MSETSHARSPLEIAGSFLDEAPVDLRSMTEALGLSVILNKNMDNGISGLIRKDASSNSGYVIEVNGSHSYYRQRFTTAHEIAHYLLHRDLIGDGIIDDAMYRSGLSSEVEAEANSMAANILMPAKLVKGVYRAGLKYTSGLSRAFEVSDEAMRIRLRQLRLGV